MNLLATLPIPRLRDDLVMVHNIVLCELAKLIPYSLRVMTALPLECGRGACTSDIRVRRRPAPIDRRRIHDRRITARTECPPAEYPGRLPVLDDLLH